MFFRRAANLSTQPIQPPSRSELARLLAYLKPYPWPMLGAVLALLAGSALGLVFPWLMGGLVDSVFARRDAAQLNQITLILIATFVARGVFYFVEGYLLNRVGERMVLDLRQQTYTHLHRLSVRFFADRRTGELLSRLSADVTAIRATLTGALASALGQLVTFAGSLALMLTLNWRLSLFILALIPALIAVAVVFGRRLRRLSTEVQDRVADTSALAEEAIGAVRVVKAFAREGYEVQRYNDQLRATFRTVMSQLLVRSAFGPLMSSLGFAALAAVLWFGGQEVLNNRLSAGDLIAFLVYGINIAGALGTFTGLYTQVQETLGASRRIFDLLDETPDIQDAPGAVTLPPVQGAVRFEQVSFVYPGSEVAALHDVTLDIAPGEVLALVGPSGAGKSTLFNLLPRFYDPTGGRITVDGYDLRAVTLHSLRSQIGIVPQDTWLFSGTVRENIAYGRLEATEEELRAAAQAANAEEFILKLPQGYATRVGERGVKLSGGQRQRIAIARALLKNPRLLLLDEATSSLDSESEHLVQEALERLLAGRTTLLIAHRLSTVHIAHRIAVLNAGRVVELGTHADLMARDGLYARLYRMQLRDERLPVL